MSSSSSSSPIVPDSEGNTPFTSPETIVPIPNPKKRRGRSEAVSKRIKLVESKEPLPDKVFSAMMNIKRIGKEMGDQIAEQVEEVDHDEFKLLVSMDKIKEATNAAVEAMVLALIKP